MAKLRAAIVGLGGICRGAHMAYYPKSQDVELVAVCDIRPDRIESFKETYGYENINGYTDYMELLEKEELDFVDICTPNYLHSIIAVEALNRGINVFCEKPDAVSVEEAVKMETAAKNSGKTLMVMRNNRHRKTAKYLKQYIEEGNMGDIYCGRCGWQRRRGIPGKGGWFTNKEQSGGGPLIDLGVHMIDLSIWLMGNPVPVAVSGCTFTKFADADDISDSANSEFGDKVEGGVFDVEDLAMGFIKFDNGACLQIEFSWASNVEEEYNYVELRGTRAGAEMKKGWVKVYTEKNGSLVDEAPLVRDAGFEHAENLKHFVDVINGKAEPDFVPVQGVNMIKILEAMYKSAETGKEVVL